MDDININETDFNQKIDVSLRAALEATPAERRISDDLSTGSSSDGFWKLIVLYSGSSQTLQESFPLASFLFLLGNYAIVTILEDNIPKLAGLPRSSISNAPDSFSLKLFLPGRPPA